MSAKRITQETFDAAVRENIEEFEMGPEEAVKEAVEQFESQGKALWPGPALVWLFGRKSVPFPSS